MDANNFTEGHEDHEGDAEQEKLRELWKGGLQAYEDYLDAVGRAADEVEQRLIEKGVLIVGPLVTLKIPTHWQPLPAEPG